MVQNEAQNDVTDSAPNQMVVLENGSTVTMRYSTASEGCYVGEQSQDVGDSEDGEGDEEDHENEVRVEQETVLLQDNFNMQSEIGGPTENGEVPVIAVQESHYRDMTTDIAQLAITDMPSSSMSFDQPSSMVSQQYDSRTCTSHALAKCVCASYPNDGLDAQNIASCLNQIFQDTSGTLPEEYNGKRIIAEKQGRSGSFTFTVVKCSSANEVVPTNDAHFIVCADDHSIYVDSCRGECFACIDSDGSDVLKYIPKSRVYAAYRVSTYWEANNRNSWEPTIRMLTYGDKADIASKLDVESYHAFGMKVYETYGDQIGLQKQEVENLHLHHCGGGSPAREFLGNLASEMPQYTVEEFGKLAKKLKRNDILLTLENWPRGLLADISNDNRETLANKLDKRMTNDWRGFADELRFSDAEITQMGQAVKTPGNYSPSKELLNRIQRKQPDFPLCYLRNLFQEVGRNDIRNDLIRIIERLRSDKN